MMGVRNIQFAEYEFYHIYNRGVDKRDIFMDIPDYKRFQELLFLSNSSEAVNVRDIKKAHDTVFNHQRSGRRVAIGAYCLMPNHFHIMLTPLEENGVSSFMNKLSTSYSMYFNKRHDRTGSLFEGRYKAKHADSDEYLKYLYSYIHLNPVKLTDSAWKENGIQDIGHAFEKVKNYRYSSLFDYLAVDREEKAILDSSHFPPYFRDPKAHTNELGEWLAYEE